MFFFSDKKKLKIPRDVYEDMVNHAMESYPHECCGILVGNSMMEKKVFYVQRATNLNKERANDRYLMDPKEINLTDRQARAQSLDIIGFYHSHPDHPARPSGYDREMGQPGYSYVIIAVDGGKEVTFKSWIFEDEGAPFKEEGLKVV